MCGGQGEVVTRNFFFSYHYLTRTFFRNQGDTQPTRQQLNRDDGEIQTVGPKHLKEGSHLGPILNGHFLCVTSKPYVFGNNKRSPPTSVYTFVFPLRVTEDFLRCLVDETESSNSVNYFAEILRTLNVGKGVRKLS